MSGELDQRAMALQAALVGTLSLERELGRGGMGVVYLARDVALDRPVAVKLLHEELSDDPAARTRFLTEARTGARLVHPNIVPIYDVGEHQSLAWFVMGFVDGEPLSNRLVREGPLSPTEVQRLLQDVGWALAAAHSAGVLHRDITLANIMIERTTGRALLVDFGLAVEFDGGEATPLVGTPEYLAPELIHGAAPTPGSDLYSLGIVGWALCTGHLPLTGDSPSEILLRRLQESPTPLDEVAPGLPRNLRRAISAAIAAEPDQRPGTIELWLGTLAGSEVVHAPALPLVRWVESGKTARPYHALAFSMVGMMAIMLDGSLGMGYLPLFGRVPSAFVVMALALSMGTLIHLGLAAWALRQTARAGYLIQDLRVALANELRRRDQQGVIPAPLLGRVVNDLAWLSGIIAMTTIFLGYALLGPSRFTMSTTLASAFWVLIEALPMLWMAWFVGIGFGFVLPARAEQPRPLRWRLRELFWNSPLSKVAFRIASVGIGRRQQAPNTLHRPTEVMLQVGINDLFGALPAPQRRGLEDLPALAERLQVKVGQARDRIALLEGAAGARSSEAAAIRDRLAALRDEAITALERLRRDLLRLGSQIATTGPLTEQLQRLHSADQQLLQALRSLP